jgi:hypothetical protein
MLASQGDPIGDLAFTLGDTTRHQRVALPGRHTPDLLNALSPIRESPRGRPGPGRSRVRARPSDKRARLLKRWL